MCRLVDAVQRLFRVSLACNSLCSGDVGNFNYPVGYTTPEGDREREREAMLSQVDQIKENMPLTL